MVDRYYKYLIEAPESVTADQLESDLLLLPQWRRDKVLSFKHHMDRVLSAKAYLLLQQGLTERYGETDTEPFVIGPHGKPSLARMTGVHFNLSHCRNGVLCVLGDTPLGCDIERIPATLKEDLCRYCFNDVELKSIHDAADPCARFARLWTMKEAVAKLTGKGLDTNIKDLLCDDLLSSVTIESAVCPDKGYAYAICYYKPLENNNSI